MNTTYGEVEKQFDWRLTPDTPVQVEKENGSLIMKVTIQPDAKEPEEEDDSSSLQKLFEDIEAMGRDMGTDDWAEDFKQSKVIQD